mgnify:CR=1 FL=1
MHIGKKVWRSYDDSRFQSSTELNSLNKFIIIIRSEKKTCEIDAGAWMEEGKKTQTQIRVGARPHSGPVGNLLGAGAERADGVPGFSGGPATFVKMSAFRVTPPQLSIFFAQSIFRYTFFFTDEWT